MTSILFALIMGCSKSTILKTTTTAQLDQVGLTRTSDISAHYIDHKAISTEALVTVVIDAEGNKTFSNDNFTFTIDAKGGQTFEKESNFYIGSFTKLNALGGTPLSFGSKMPKSGAIKSNKDYAMELLHFNLIQQARKEGADAILGDINYEWEIKEKSDLETKLFGLITNVVNQEINYKVTGYCRTAKMVMNPYEDETSTQEQSSEQRMDIKLDLDIKTEGDGDFSSDEGSNGGLLKKLGK
jgi:hypothetical protein